MEYFTREHVFSENKFANLKRVIFWENNFWIIFIYSIDKKLK